MQEVEELKDSILDSLAAHVAVLDSKGYIIAVNSAWRNFCAENSQEGKRANAGLGENYLKICESANGENSDEARDMYLGLLSVLQEESLIYCIEYPCHSPTEKRWFRAYATKMSFVSSIYFIVAHLNITDEVLSGQITNVRA